MDIVQDDDDAEESEGEEEEEDGESVEDGVGITRRKTDEPSQSRSTVDNLHFPETAINTLKASDPENGSHLRSPDELTQKVESLKLSDIITGSRQTFRRLIRISSANTILSGAHARWDDPKAVRPNRTKKFGLIVVGCDIEYRI